MRKYAPPLIYLSALLLSNSAAVNGAILLNDTFADGDRTNQSLSGSAAHYYGSTNANGTLDVSGEAMQFQYSTTTNVLSQVVAYFTPSGSPVALAVGDSLSASFSFSGSNIANAGDSLRIGLYNSGGSRVSADTTGIANAAFNSYTGYGLWTNLNGSGSNTTDLVQRSGSSTTLFAGGAHSDLSASTGSLAYTADTSYTLTLHVVRSSDAQVTVSFSDSNGYLSSTTDSTSPYTSFDTFALFLSNGSTLTTYRIDNVTVQSFLVPEPGVMALCLLGTGFAWIRRRRSF